MKIVQLNIERNRHLDRVTNFLAETQPDVVCLQEVMEDACATLARTLGMHATYVPMAHIRGFENAPDDTMWGTALLTREPHVVTRKEFYVGSEDVVPVVFHSQSPEGDNAPRRVLLMAEVRVRDQTYVVGNTHFTWTRDGLPNDEQRRDFAKFLKSLPLSEDFVLCGDFNIPRGTELYSVLAQQLTDCVPQKYDHSLDPAYHRAPNLRLMVDYIWSTRGYEVRDVRMVCGVSDHCALVGEVIKTP